MAYFPCNIGGGGNSPVETKELIYSIDESQGGVWVNSNIDTTLFTELYFRFTDSVSGADYIATVKVEDIAVYTGGADVFTTVFPSAVSVLQFNVRIYNNELYVSFNGTGANTRVVGVYKKITVKGNATVKQGTFVSASSQFGIVDVEVGFKPDMVMVRLPFGNNDTTSYWEKDMSWAETNAMWNLYPAETVTYFVDLDRQHGETGIQAINNNGFSFMSNGGNTQGVTCEYIAVKYEVPQPQPEDKTYLFKDGEWKNQDILSLYGYNTSIENGSLKCTGTHAGVVVDDVSGLDSSVTQYSVYLKVRAGNVNTYPIQTGRNVPTQNLYDIIHYGTDRYSYNTDFISSGTDYLFVINALSNTDGVFLGTENYTDDNAYYYIDEIWLEETPTQIIVHS